MKDEHNPIYEVEFGAIMPIRFLDASQLAVYDSEGNEVLCSCGKPAGSGVIGRDSFIAKCTECMYGERKT